MNTRHLLAAVAVMLWSGYAAAKPDHGNPHARGAGAPVGDGIGGCPPGLAKKNAACMPPGRYRKLFEVGQRVPYNFQGITGYDSLPFDVRHRYGASLDPRSRYIYDQGTVYRIDPATMVVSQVLQTILR